MDLRPFVVTGEKLLLVGCNSGDDLLAFFLCKSKLMVILFLFCLRIGSIILILGTMTLEGMIASDPNAIEKGVSLVARCLVVLYAHRTPGSLSSHFSFLFERDS